MSSGGGRLIGGMLWSAGSFGAIFVFKIGSSIILSRLLAPEIFGVMVIVTTIRVGIELLSDLGLEQNLVHSPRGLEPRFFNTIWTVQILRGLLLSLAFLALSPLASHFYAIDVNILLLMSVTPFINALASPSIYATVKRLEVRKRNLFEVACEGLNLIIGVTIAYFVPTVWALVWGVVLGLSIRSALSYFLDRVRHRLTLDRESVREIVRFGKWIMLTSLLMYFATSLDRLYLGSVASFHLLGVYGIARQISDLPTALSRRLSYQVLFPMLSANTGENRSDAVSELRSVRWKLILLAALGLGVFTGLADIAIRLVYDPRYAGAGWMLFGLMWAAWLSVLSNLNEALVLGSGRPAYSSFANISRLVVLGVGLPTGFAMAGIPGAITAVGMAELAQYVFMAIGQHRVGLSFRTQDLIGTLVFLAAVGCDLAARYALGFGVPWLGQ